MDFQAGNSKRRSRLREPPLSWKWYALWSPCISRAQFFHFLESSSKAPRFHRSTIEKSKRRWIWAARVLDYWNQMNQITLRFLIDWSENNCFFRESSSCSFRTVIVNEYKKEAFEKVKNLGGNGTLKFVIVLIFSLELVICRHLSIYELWKSPVVCVLAAPKENNGLTFSAVNGSTFAERWEVFKSPKSAEL